jgi:hypothetical protein
MHQDINTFWLQRVTRLTTLLHLNQLLSTFLTPFTKTKIRLYSFSQNLVA